MPGLWLKAFLLKSLDQGIHEMEVALKIKDNSNNDSKWLAPLG